MSHTGAGFRRDRLTLTLYGTFITWGWFLYGFSPAVPLIAVEQGTSRAVAGLHGTAMAVGTVVAGLLSSELAIRLGRRTQVAFGAVLCSVGLVGLLVGPSNAWTLPAVVVTAVGGNFLISAAQPALALHHGRNGPAAVTEANAAGSGVGLLAPLAVGATVAAGLTWRPAVAVVLLLAAAVVVLVLRVPATGALGRGTRRAAVPVTPAADDAARVEGVAPSATSSAAPRTASASLASRLRPGFGRTFWLFWGAMLCGVAIEFATTFWAADLVVSRTGAGPSVATATVSALVAGMTASRLVLGPLSTRRPPEKLLLGAYGVAAVGFALLWSATSPGVAVAGLVLAGLGYGAHYPLAVALVLRAADGRPDQAQATSTVGTGMAVAVAPFLLGALADAFGSHRAFLLVAGLIAVGALLVALGVRQVRLDSAAQVALAT